MRGEEAREFQGGEQHVSKIEQQMGKHPMGLSLIHCNSFQIMRRGEHLEGHSDLIAVSLMVTLGTWWGWEWLALPLNAGVSSPPPTSHKDQLGKEWVILSISALETRPGSLERDQKRTQEGKKGGRR